MFRHCTGHPCAPPAGAAASSASPMSVSRDGTRSWPASSLSVLSAAPPAAHRNATMPELQQLLAMTLSNEVDAEC